jgi:NAD(P)H-hydrate epimerase
MVSNAADPLSTRTVPALTREQMIEVDRGMEEMGITLLQRMESAGRHLAHLARDRFLAGAAIEKSVVVLAGSGGKGSGALVAARRLSIWGARVEVFLIRPRGSYESSLAGPQLSILERLEVPVRGVEEPLATEGADVVVDGMVGRGLRGSPKGEVADAVRWARAERVPILSLGVPTGMDADSGAMSSPALAATATLALGLPNKGLVAPGAEEFRGELYLGDVGIPEILFRRAGIKVGPIFSETDLLRLG